MKLSNRFTNVSPLLRLGELEDKLPTDLDIYIGLFLYIAKETDNLVCLRGNILLNQLLSDSARSTKDLDMHVAMSVDIYNKKVLPLLTEFAEAMIYKGLADSYSIREITEKSGGNIKIRKTIAGQQLTVYSVDTELNMNITTGATKYEFNNQQVLGSSIEKIIADKCLSTLSVKRFRRIKDFYDLYIIVDSGLYYDIKEIYNLMVNYVGESETMLLLDSIPFATEILDKLTEIWDSFTVARFDDKQLVKPPFHLVYNRLNSIYTNLKLVAKEV